jgi:DNA-directed RNA polymerase subunit N (RpoN/RPB10)
LATCVRARSARFPPHTSRPSALAVDMDDPISGLVIPPTCFTCGMPVSNKVATFTFLVHTGVAAEEAFRRLGVRHDCCRRMLFCAPLDPRYRPKPPAQGHFVTVHHLSKLEAAPFTLWADGRTDPAPEPPATV